MGLSRRQTKKPGKGKAEEEDTGRIRALKGYFLYQEIQTTTHMSRARHMLRKDLRGP